MGWDDIEVTSDLSAALREELGRTNGGKVIDLEVTEGDDGYAAVAYAAIEAKGPAGRKVEAVVCLIDFEPDSGGRTYMLKQMSEAEGPCACDCPERILDLLTSTDSDDAADWRARCRRAAAMPSANGLMN